MFGILAHLPEVHDAHANPSTRSMFSEFAAGRLVIPREGTAPPIPAGRSGLIWKEVSAETSKVWPITWAWRMAVTIEILGTTRESHRLGAAGVCDASLYQGGYITDRFAAARASLLRCLLSLRVPPRSHIRRQSTADSFETSALSLGFSSNRLTERQNPKGRNGAR
jgi:hypothetical protein